MASDANVPADCGAILAWLDRLAMVASVPTERMRLDCPTTAASVPTERVRLDRSATAASVPTECESTCVWLGRSAAARMGQRQRLGQFNDASTHAWACPRY